MSLFLLSYGIIFVFGRPFTLQPPNFELNTLMYEPVLAVDYIKQHGLKGNILSEFDWGEYLLWELYPDCKVAFDGRYETVYSKEVSLEFFNFLKGRGDWKVFLDKYPHDMILIYPVQGLRDSLNKLGWHEVFEAPGSLLLTRPGYERADAG